MRRVFRRIALCLCALVLLCSCEQPDDPQPTLTDIPARTLPPTADPEPARFSLGWDPTVSLNPITGDSQVNQELTGLVYQGLYELDNTFAPQPVLAAGASVSEDALRWTFTLAEGTLFSDGTPLTARHVAASLNQARTSALYAARLAAVSSVTAGEDGAVHITLSAPNAALPALLDIPIVLEPGKDENADLPPAPLGTGYYRYVREGDGLHLEINHFHPAADSLPYDAIPLIPVSDTGERIAAFDIGAVSAVTTDFLSPYALGYTDGYEITDYPTTSLLYVGFNTASRVCRSPLVRQAFSRAFDRAALVETQLAGHGDPAALPVSPLSADYSEGYASLLDYDAEAAAQLLAQAGYTLHEEDGLLYDGKNPVEISLLVNSDNAARQAVAQQLADELAALGVTATVSRLAWNDFIAALNGGKFDLYLGEVRLTGDFDPSVLLTGKLNYGKLQSPELTRALNQWRLNQGVWRDLAAGIYWKQFVQDVPIASLCFMRNSLLVRRGMVANAQPTRANPWYQMEQWIITR